jgi:hypothetical protein
MNGLWSSSWKDSALNQGEKDSTKRKYLYIKLYSVTVQKTGLLKFIAVCTLDLINLIAVAQFVETALQAWRSQEFDFRWGLLNFLFS